MLIQLIEETNRIQELMTLHANSNSAKGVNEFKTESASNLSNMQNSKQSIMVCQTQQE